MANSVSLSRAKESTGVSLVGFSRANFIPPPMEVQSLYTELEVVRHEVLPPGRCCKSADYKSEVCQDLSSYEVDSSWDVCDIEDFQFTEEDTTEMDNSVKNFFENCENNELTLINLDESWMVWILVRI